MKIKDISIKIFEKTNCTLMLLPVSVPFYTRSLLGLFLHDTVRKEEGKIKDYCILYMDILYFQITIFKYPT